MANDSAAAVFIFLFFAGLVVLIIGFIVTFWGNMEHFGSGITIIAVGMLMMYH